MSEPICQKCHVSCQKSLPFCTKRPYWKKSPLICQKSPFSAKRLCWVPLPKECVEWTQDTQCALLYDAVCCSVLQSGCCSVLTDWTTLQHPATQCNTLQHTATHGNTRQHTATHGNTRQHTVTHCNTLQHTQYTQSTLLYGNLAEKRKAVVSKMSGAVAQVYGKFLLCCSMLQRVAACCSTLQQCVRKCIETVCAHFLRRRTYIHVRISAYSYLHIHIHVSTCVCICIYTYICMHK